VAADASPATPVAIVLDGKIEFIGGTSAATPIWAGFMGLVNQARLAAKKSTLGWLTPRLYPPLPRGAFRDITVGNNGFPAKVGYDLVTGWGAPLMNIMLPDLVARP
jgi:kumamolisin